MAGLHVHLRAVTLAASIGLAAASGSCSCPDRVVDEPPEDLAEPACLWLISPRAIRADGSTRMILDKEHDRSGTACLCITQEEYDALGDRLDRVGFPEEGTLLDEYNELAYDECKRGRRPVPRLLRAWHLAQGHLLRPRRLGQRQAARIHLLRVDARASEGRGPRWCRSPRGRPWAMAGRSGGNGRAPTAFGATGSETRARSRGYHWIQDPIWTARPPMPSTIDGSKGMMRSSSGKTPMDPTKPRDSKPITLTLRQVLEGAARAERIVERWPEWKRELSPSTWSERGDLNPIETTDSEPITLTLRQVLEGAARAEKIVAGWPEWKRELSPSTWSEREGRRRSKGDETR